MSIAQKISAQKAFTLIEVLVSVAILGILSTIILVNASGSRVTQDLEAGAREMVSFFRGVQNRALTGEQVGANTIPCRFEVTWDGASYSVIYHSKDNNGACVNTATIQSYTLRNGVVFSSPGNVRFTLPHADVFDTAGPVAVSKAVTLSKAGATYSVCIYKEGLINQIIGNTCP